MFYCVYSSVAFGKKEVEGAFVKHFVPELEKFGQKYIYKPWKAPIADQKMWGCDQGRRECSGRGWDEGVSQTDVGF